MKKKKTGILIIVIMSSVLSIIGLTSVKLDKNKDYIDELVDKYNPQGASVVIIKRNCYKIVEYIYVTINYILRRTLWKVLRKKENLVFG